MTADKLPIFRVIDGELQRVPGDIRDPCRRYSQVASESGAYLREFTDEEERERDREEAEYRANRPHREAEAKKNQEEYEKFRASLRYENRVVAFLDILGWESAVDTSEDDDKLTETLGITISNIQNQRHLVEWVHQEGMDAKSVGDPHLTHFSDCVLFSVMADRMSSFNLEFYLRGLVASMMGKGFLVRGGVSAGALIHRRSMAYGPALNRAVQLEKQAKMPRVLLDEHIATIWKCGPEVFDKSGRLLGRQKIWRTDRADGKVYFDFLQPFANMPGTPINVPLLNGVLKPFRDMVVSRLVEHRNSDGIYEKYKWAASYFNEILDEYPESGLSKISTS